MKAALVSIALICAVVTAATGQIREDASVAFLGITFLDTSTEGAYSGPRQDEADRLALLEGEVRTQFTDHGLTLLDLAPIAENLESTTNPANCYGCEIRMARELGADYVLVGVVQKVSNLILAMNLVMRDVETEEVVAYRVVEIRSNTDDSWLRGIRYILKTAFFKP
ncbi:DUF3280 domain-containing protein [Roseovarius sp. M141]|uniref:DUF3280 domain-containing protein n=1 Tax=Roseovarius sp. M141 TaxID=2583806 RepID=UPI0020CF430B|nr:DUF3280 domain-containing protein [Roseovarius sp. M141]MCQ0093113.1 DUF2380 domain-containing protein [Roseovarius sp. M141]